MKAFVRDNALGLAFGAAFLLTLVGQSLAGLADFGVVKDRVQTTGLAMEPVYDYPNYGPPVLRGYRVTQRARVTVPELDRAAPEAGLARAGLALPREPLQEVARFEHAFTHFRMKARVWGAEVGAESDHRATVVARDGPPLHWLPIDEAATAPLPRPVRTLLETLSALFLKRIGYYGLVELEYKLDSRDGLFKLLDELKYDGWVGCEYRPAKGTAAGLTWLYRLLDRRPAAQKAPG